MLKHALFCQGTQRNCFQGKTINIQLQQAKEKALQMKETE